MPFAHSFQIVPLTPLAFRTLSKIRIPKLVPFLVLASYDIFIPVKRIDFIKHLIALGRIPFLSGKGIQTRHFQKFYLLQCFVRGFQYYEGPGLVGQMKEGDLLELVREPNNEYDHCAIALHWNRKKIRFIPAEDNGKLSKLLDIGLPELIAEITHLQPEAATWENVRVAVYVLKEIEDNKPLPPTVTWLTQLETPKYRTLKWSDDILTRVQIDEDDAETEMDLEEAKEFFFNLSDHEKTNGLFQNSPDNDSRHTGFLVVNKKRLSQSPGLAAELRSLESELKNADAMFEEDGYIVLSTRKIESLVDRISGLGEVADKLGRKFIELKLG